MFSLCVLIGHCVAEVDHVDAIFSGLITSNQKVVGLDATVDDALFMHYFDALDHLLSNMADGLQIKFAITLLKQIFQTLAQLIHNHNVENAAIFALFVSYKVEVGHPGLAPQFVNQFGLPKQPYIFLIFDC